MKRSTRPLNLILPPSLAAAMLLPAGAAPEPWPQFRGPGGDGVAEARSVPVEIGEDHPSLAWKAELPGRGWSSPVFDGEHLWLTAAEETFPTEEERIARLEAEGDSERVFHVRQVADRIDLTVLQVDFETGELVRRIDLGELENPQTIHIFNSFASPTPVLTDGLLITHFGAFGTWAIDIDSGEIVWQRRIEIEHAVGPGSSPYVHENLLILICDGVDRQFVTALDTATGETVWETERPEMRADDGDQKKSYNTPIAITDANGREQLICMSSQWLVSYNPLTGEEYWRFDHGDGFSVVPRPVFSEAHQLIYICTGFGETSLYAVRPDGEGDITGTDRVAWQETQRIPRRPSPLLLGDDLFLISEGGVASCLDAATGEVLWNERINGNYTASPLYADGRVYVASEEGVVTAFRPSRTYEEVGSGQIDGTIMASPLAFDGTLLIRSDTALYRFSN